MHRERVDRRSQAQVFAGRSGARARAECHRLTMDCDVDQEISTRHIRHTLDDIGVDRIDHGVNLNRSGYSADCFDCITRPEQYAPVGHGTQNVDFIPS